MQIAASGTEAATASSITNHMSESVWSTSPMVAKDKAILQTWTKEPFIYKNLKPP